MRMRIPIFRLLAAALLCALVSAGVHAQVEADLQAQKRIFPGVGAGVWAVKRGPGGRFYVLVARSIFVYDSSGAKVSEIPAPPAKGASSAPVLVYGVAFDVDSEGRIYVADRGGNALRVFSSEGAVLFSIPFNSPTGIAALSGGEFAATSANPKRLITIFDSHGKEDRQIGQPLSVVEDNVSFNYFMNIGRIVTDPANNIYFAFDYMPEPSFRKYDRQGYALLDITLNSLEFAPAGQALRREIRRELDHGILPQVKPSISCIGVDPATQRIWIGLGSNVLLFDTDGRELAEYRLFTPEGARLPLNSILVLPDKLVMSSDPLGVYEFSRPDKDILPAAPEKKPQ